MYEKSLTLGSGQQADLHTTPSFMIICVLSLALLQFSYLENGAMNSSCPSEFLWLFSEIMHEECATRSSCTSATTPMYFHTVECDSKSSPSGTAYRSKMATIEAQCEEQGNRQHCFTNAVLCMQKYFERQGFCPSSLTTVSIQISPKRWRQ